MKVYWSLDYVLSCMPACLVIFVFFFKHKTAYEMRISDWSSNVCSSDLACRACPSIAKRGKRGKRREGPSKQGLKIGLVKRVGCGQRPVQVDDDRQAVGRGLRQRGDRLFCQRMRPCLDISDRNRHSLRP